MKTEHSINLNESVAVRLTPCGVRLWEEHWSDYPGGLTQQMRDGSTLSDGRVKFQLWTLMSIFHPAMHLCAETAFENNRIWFLE